MAGGGVKINNISVVGGANGKTPTFKIEGGYLYNSYDNGANWYVLGKVEGQQGQPGQQGATGSDGVGISSVAAVGTSFVFTLTNGTSSTATPDTTDCTPLSEAELSALIISTIDTTASATSETTPSVTVSEVNGKVRFAFTLPQGAAGVGVSTISVSNGYLVFGLTDGTSIPVALPVYDGTGD